MLDKLSASFLLALFGFLAVLYFGYFTREIEPFPPANDDQAAYLTELYTLAAKVHDGGLVRLVQSLAQPGSGASAVFPLEGAVVHLLTNGGRLAALLVNFIALCLLLTIAFASISEVTQSRWVAGGTLGAILAQATYWVGAGGLFDYRIDFVAFCFYGAWVCAIIRSDIFVSRKWSVIAGLLAAALVLNRVLSILYIAGSTACVITALVLASRFCPKNNVALRLGQRMTNIAISTAIFVAVSAPLLVVNWPAIQYRYIGLHLFADDKTARQISVGIVHWFDNFTYYPWAIWNDHLGRGFLLASIAFCLGIAAHVVQKAPPSFRSQNRRGSADTIQVALEVAFLLSTILVPLAVLTANSIKYSSVAGVIGVPIALALTFVPARILAGRAVTPPIVIGAVAAFGIGIAVHLDHSVRRPPLGSLAMRQGWADTVLWIHRDARERGVGSPRIFFDLAAPQWNAAVFTAFGYEKSGVLVSFNHIFPRSILAFERSEAIGALKEADYVVLSEVPKAGPYPFFAAMAGLERDVREWVDANLVFRASFPVGYTVRVYTPPRPKQ